MPYNLDFEIKHRYPDQEPGITIPVFLTYGSKTEKILAKLDTGADFCVFTYELALLLGVPVTSGPKKIFDTSGGLVETYGHEVTIKSFDFEHTAFVYFAVTSGHRRNLLGRQGWLRNFQLGIIDYENALYLSPYNT
ncbi:MAG: aspartyl protease family protein [Acidobacteria bacterium]|nr:aspartyl protease family protein [Acidobacteriota bacterium]